MVFARNAVQQSVNFIVQSVVEKYSPAAGSKCIRSKLALLYLYAVGLEVTDEHRHFLTAIELIHNASLLHDDILDNAEERRGMLAFRDKKALITGDYLLAVAMQMVPLYTMTMLIKTLENMCLGEFTQLEGRGTFLSLEQYLLKTEQKTAGLFEAAFAGCGLPTEFAHNFGMLFQLRNDVRDREQDEAVGIFNPVTPELLDDYIGRALENLAHLEDNEYKQELEKFINE
jgi:geranylgeranyl pyrophosphate synthase